MSESPVSYEIPLEVGRSFGEGQGDDSKDKPMEWMTGRSDARALSPFLGALERVRALEPEMSGKRDRELAEEATFLRQRAFDGVPVDDLLQECFALTREVACRALGERPYDVQMVAGIALHRGKLVEMQTGEGKTLAAVAPVALNASSLRGPSATWTYLVHDHVFKGKFFQALASCPAIAGLGVISTFQTSGTGLQPAVSDTESRQPWPSCSSRRPSLDRLGIDEEHITGDGEKGHERLLQ